MLRSKKYQPRKKGLVSKKGGLRRSKTMRKIKKHRLTKKKMKGGKNENFKILILPIYKYVLSYSNTEKKIKIWNKDGGKDQWIGELTQDNPVLFVACFPDGNTIMSVCEEYIYLWKSVGNKKWKSTQLSKKAKITEIANLDYTFIQKKSGKDTAKITCVAVCETQNFIAFAILYDLIFKNDKFSKIFKITYDGKIIEFTIKTEFTTISQIAFSTVHCFFAHNISKTSYDIDKITKAAIDDNELTILKTKNLRYNLECLMVLPDGTCFYQSGILTFFYIIDSDFENMHKIRFDFGNADDITIGKHGKLMKVYNKNRKNYFVFYCNKIICIASQPQKSYKSYKIYNSENRDITSKSNELKEIIHHAQKRFYGRYDKNDYVFQRDFSKFKWFKISNVTSFDVLSKRSFVCGCSDSIIRFSPNLTEFKSEERLFLTDTDVSQRKKSNIEVYFYNEDKQFTGHNNTLESSNPSKYKISFFDNRETVPYIDDDNIIEQPDNNKINTTFQIKRAFGRTIEKVCNIGSRNCVAPDNKLQSEDSDSEDSDLESDNQSEDSDLESDNQSEDSDLESVDSEDD